MSSLKSSNMNPLLEDFVKTQRNKTIAWLQKNFNITHDDCEDIFQESFIVLDNNIKKGKLDNLTSSVSTYFMAICRNKTMELLKSNGKYIKYDFTNIDESTITFDSNKVDIILSLEHDDTDNIEEKEALVRKMVRNLPSPCNELLWGYYRDGFSMKVLAKQYGYSSESAVKVTKHRCCEKFHKKFSELYNKLKGAL